MFAGSFNIFFCFWSLKWLVHISATVKPVGTEIGELRSLWGKTWCRGLPSSIPWTDGAWAPWHGQWQWPNCSQTGSDFKVFGCLWMSLDKMPMFHEMWCVKDWYIDCIYKVYSDTVFEKSTCKSQTLNLRLSSGAASFAWQNFKKPGAHVIRGALMHLMYQLDQGVCCPITMTFASLNELNKQQPFFDLSGPGAFGFALVLKHRITFGSSWFPSIVWHFFNILRQQFLLWTWWIWTSPSRKVLHFCKAPGSSQLPAAHVFRIVNLLGCLKKSLNRVK